MVEETWLAVVVVVVVAVHSEVMLRFEVFWQQLKLYAMEAPSGRMKAEEEARTTLES